MFDNLFVRPTRFTMFSVSGTQAPSLMPIGVRGALRAGLEEIFLYCFRPKVDHPSWQWGSMPVLVRDLAS